MWEGGGGEGGLKKSGLSILCELHRILETKQFPQITDSPQNFHESGILKTYLRHILTVFSSGPTSFDPTTPLIKKGHIVKIFIYPEGMGRLCKYGKWKKYKGHAPICTIGAHKYQSS